MTVMKATSGVVSAELNGVSLEWDLDEGKLSFFGLPTAMFWLDPSLLRMLQPLVEEMGAPLFRLVVAHTSGIGAEEDYRAMVTVLGSTFEEGFLAWGHSVSAAGWGRFELPSFDREARRAVVRVHNPWELRMQQGIKERWGCPFLLGKLIGIFSCALGANCWAEEREIQSEGGALCVELEIFLSQKTITAEIAALREQRSALTRAPLERELAERARVEQELGEKLTLIERQQQAIRALSTPILQVWEGVLAMPIIGVVDSQRAAAITEALLNEITRRRARFAIIDLTGVELVDTATANHFARIVRAAGLLGAECLTCGIRPAVAQAMVALGAVAESRTFANMQDALEAVIRAPRGARKNAF